MMSRSWLWLGLASIAHGMRALRVWIDVLGLDVAPEAPRWKRTALGACALVAMSRGGIFVAELAALPGAWIRRRVLVWP